jgi:hypothetical protein
LWRVVGSERFSATLIEIESSWTMADVERANLALDIFEDAQILSTPPIPKAR